MSAPAGWYPDPQTPVPGAPPQQRYWDGQTWTQHVAPTVAPTAAPTAAPVTQQSYQQPTYGQQYGQQYGQAQDSQSVGQQYPQAGGQQYGQPYGQQPYVGAPAYVGALTTPDGVPLAGWWHRVGAYVIDILILGVILVAVAFPFIRDVLSAFGDYFDEAVTAAENGTPTPSSSRFAEDIAGPSLVIAAIGLVVNFVYTVAFLAWKQATPGKLAVGLRVRLRERPELPVSAICLRWLVQFFVPSALGRVPLLGFVFSLFWFLDHLWPLWDNQQQALHDKAAKTNVVRVR